MWWGCVTTGQLYAAAQTGGTAAAKHSLDDQQTLRNGVSILSAALRGAERRWSGGGQVREERDGEEHFEALDRRRMERVAEEPATL